MTYARSSSTGKVWRITPWTPENVALLRRLWLMGLSASRIADQMPGITRNAVIGKAHRLGLEKRPSPIKRPERRDIRPSACQWPHGHVGDPGFHFCGAETVPGKPYCEHHMRRAYVSVGKVNTYGIDGAA